MLLEDEEEGVEAEMRSMDVTMHLLDGEHRHHQKDNYYYLILAAVTWITS
jgi:hypothetical protein